MNFQTDVSGGSLPPAPFERFPKQSSADWAWPPVGLCVADGRRSAVCVSGEGAHVLLLSSAPLQTGRQRWRVRVTPSSAVAVGVAAVGADGAVVLSWTGGYSGSERALQNAGSRHRVVGGGGDGQRLLDCVADVPSEGPGVLWLQPVPDGAAITHSRADWASIPVSLDSGCALYRCCAFATVGGLCTNAPTPKYSSGACASLRSLAVARRVPSADPRACAALRVVATVPMAWGGDAEADCAAVVDFVAEDPESDVDGLRAKAAHLLRDGSSSTMESASHGGVSAVQVLPLSCTPEGCPVVRAVLVARVGGDTSANASLSSNALRSSVRSVAGVLHVSQPVSAQTFALTAASAWRRKCDAGGGTFAEMQAASESRLGLPLQTAVAALSTAAGHGRGIAEAVVAALWFGEVAGQTAIGAEHAVEAATLSEALQQPEASARRQRAADRYSKWVCGSLGLSASATAVDRGDPLWTVATGVHGAAAAMALREGAQVLLSAPLGCTYRKSDALALCESLRHDGGGILIRVHGLRWGYPVCGRSSAEMLIPALTVLHLDSGVSRAGAGAAMCFRVVSEPLHDGVLAELRDEVVVELQHADSQLRKMAAATAVDPPLPPSHPTNRQTAASPATDPTIPSQPQTRIAVAPLDSRPVSSSAAGSLAAPSKAAAGRSVLKPPSQHTSAGLHPRLSLVPSDASSGDSSCTTPVPLSPSLRGPPPTAFSVTQRSPPPSPTRRPAAAQFAAASRRSSAAVTSPTPDRFGTVTTQPDRYETAVSFGESTARGRVLSRIQAEVAAEIYQDEMREEATRTQSAATAQVLQTPRVPVRTPADLEADRTAVCIYAMRRAHGVPEGYSPGIPTPPPHLHRSL
eukprot:TRINITY_DN29694_c0_g1_i1.p1 TRINITY_DN29694_c0_g1~~TRINITY_DN29694_c0_g1_i1.p1  ORF type:complete len:876 (+),score=233.86 TRINITY_DN29694_c0_g1_i1:44-2629(+)